MIVLDRFEEGFAVLETDSGNEIIERSLLPAGAREGDVLERSGEGFAVDEVATRERKLSAKRKLRRLTRKK